MGSVATSRAFVSDAENFVQVATVSRNHGVTLNSVLLFSASFGVVTLTKPLVAPAGIVARIRVFDETVNVAAVPLKVTLVVPVRLFPRMKTFVPTLPEVGRVKTNGRSPSERLNTVPHPDTPVMQTSTLCPPVSVVP